MKDIIDTADMPTGMGSRDLRRLAARRRMRAVVAALRRAGATILGKTTTTAFASSDPTADPQPARRRRTRRAAPRPARPPRSAAGMVPLALGTQTGGSVIRPGLLCGAAAIKPSFRLIPTVGVKCYAWTLDTVGLFAAGVRGPRAGARHPDRPPA